MQKKLPGTKSRKRIASILAVALTVGALAGCGGTVEPVPVEESAEEETPKIATVYLNPFTMPEGSQLIYNIPNLLPKISTADKKNSDTIGWLQIPNTSLDDVVVYYDDSAAPKSNDYYLRRSFDKAYSFDGTYFADYRCKFDGTAGGLVRNTVIYGHSMNDKIDGRLMNQLKKYDHQLNPDGEQFTKDNPYIFFSLEDENLAWEIFAVFCTKTNFRYNIPTQTDEDFETIISEALARSLYLYNTEVTTRDKILTLSTCTYKYDPNYPNDYRYVIMAKLVEPGTPLKQQASFVVNPAPKAP